VAQPRFQTGFAEEKRDECGLPLDAYSGRVTALFSPPPALFERNLDSLSSSDDIPTKTNREIRRRLEDGY